MDAAKHTPGPWKLRRAGGTPFDEGILPEKCHAVDARKWASLALIPTQMIDESNDDPEGIANARLIAAAPDLLAALKGILTANVDGKNVERYLDAIDDARAAIAKAEGRTDG